MDSGDALGRRKDRQGEAFGHRSRLTISEISSNHKRPLRWFPACFQGFCASLSWPTAAKWITEEWYFRNEAKILSVQFSSVSQSCPTLCNPMNHSTPGLPVHHHLLEFTQTHVHQVSDDIQPVHPLSSPSPPAPNPSQHQSLVQWLSSLHEVAKVMEFQL